MAARAPRRSARLLHSEPTVVGPAGDAPASFHFTPAAGTAQPGSPVTRFNVVLGQLVCRGVDWKWDNQDGGVGTVGTVTALRGNSATDQWVRVCWLQGHSNAYRCGHRDKYDLIVAPSTALAQGCVVSPQLARPGLRVWPSAGQEGQEASVAAGGPTAGGVVTAVVELDSADHNSNGDAARGAPRAEATLATALGASRAAVRRRGAPPPDATDEAVPAVVTSSLDDPNTVVAITVRWDNASHGVTHTYVVRSDTFPLRTEPPPEALADAHPATNVAQPPSHPVVAPRDVVIGLRVIRGPDWCAGAAQDGGPGGEGNIVPWAQGQMLGTNPRWGWVFVQWQHSQVFSVHRIGAQGRHDLAHVTARRPRLPTSRAALAAAALATAPMMPAGSEEGSGEPPLTVGDIVTVSVDYARYVDAADGPLHPGGPLGRVVRDDGSTQPLEVAPLSGGGRPWWYARQALRRAGPQHAARALVEDAAAVAADAGQRADGRMAQEANAMQAAIVGRTQRIFPPPSLVPGFQPAPVASSDDDAQMEDDEDDDVIHVVPPEPPRRSTGEHPSSSGAMRRTAPPPPPQARSMAPDLEGLSARSVEIILGATATPAERMAAMLEYISMSRSPAPGAPGASAPVWSAETRRWIPSARAETSLSARAFGRQRGGLSDAQPTGTDSMPHAMLRMPAPPGSRPASLTRVTRSRGGHQPPEHGGGTVGGASAGHAQATPAAGGAAQAAAPRRSFAGDDDADRMALRSLAGIVLQRAQADRAGPPPPPTTAPAAPAARPQSGASAQLLAAQADVGAPVTTATALVGLRVCRGIDWRWNEQDGGPGGVGTIRRSTLPGALNWCTVSWDAGGRFSYRTGAQGAYDLCVAPQDAPPAPASAVSEDAPAGVPVEAPRRGWGSTAALPRARVPSSRQRQSSGLAQAVASAEELSARMDAMVEDLEAATARLPQIFAANASGLVPPGRANPRLAGSGPPSASPRFAVGDTVVLAPHAAHHGGIDGVLTPGQVGTVVDIDTSATPNCVADSSGRRHWYSTAALHRAPGGSAAAPPSSTARTLPGFRAGRPGGRAGIPVDDLSLRGPPRHNGSVPRERTNPRPVPRRREMATPDLVPVYTQEQTNSIALAAGIAAALDVCNAAPTAAASSSASGSPADKCRRLRDAIAAYSDGVHYVQQQAASANHVGGTELVTYIAPVRRLPLMLHVSRGRLVSEAQAQFGPLGSPGWSSPLGVRFQSEGGVDSGGLTREFFSAIGQAAAGSRCLVPTAVEGAFEVYFDPGATSPQDVADAGFIGAIVAKVLLEGGGLRGSRHGGQLTLCGLRLALPAFKLLVGEPVTADDLASIDPATAASLAHVASTPGAASDGALGDATFELEYVSPHTRDGAAAAGASSGDDGISRHALMPGGKHVLVNEANKALYCRLRAEWALTTGPAHLLAAFMDGFYSLVPRQVVDALRLDGATLRLAVCGHPTVDLMGDVRRHTVYGNGYSARHPVVRWLWDVLGEWPEHRRLAFWRFCTGGDGLPPEGAVALAPPFSVRRAPRSQPRTGAANGAAAFYAAIAGGAAAGGAVGGGRLATGTVAAAVVAASAAPADGADEANMPPRLPMVHTCFRALDLPEYRSKEELSTALLKAIEFGAVGFEHA